MKLTPNGRKRLQLLTTIFLVLTVIAIIFTLAAWIVSEPGSFEPLNVLFFAVLSVLTAISAWLGRANNVIPPETSTIAEAETIAQGPLRRQMSDSLDLNELRTLCLDIGIRYDSLSGDTIEDKTASLVAYMQRRGQLGQLTAVLQRERPHVTWLLPAQLEQQYGLRRNVRAAWIEGVLKQSVTDEIALELKLTYQPQTLTRKVFYVPGQVDRPVEKDVPGLFAEFGSLLILGEPGSGKTMTLLQLAESLLAAAEADPAQPTPVVLNLSSWAAQQGALSDWMVEELLLQYQLPRETGRRLIASSGLIHLLDGLDEVAAEARDACVSAINEFKAQQPAPLAVCCRLAEYEGLSEKLNLGMGGRIQPLSDTQVEEYLSRPELKLAAVRQMVQTDDALHELAQTPLFLSVMTLAYRGMTTADLEQLPTQAARRNHLYRHYVAEMWRRRPLNGNEPYDETQAMTWLTSLAHSITQHEQTTFYMERLQPTWLPTNRLRRYYVWIYGLVLGLIFGPVIGLIFGLPIGLLVSLIDGPIAGLNVGLDAVVFFGAIFGLLLWIDSGLQPIQLYEELTWVSQLPEVLETLLFFCIFGLVCGLICGLPLWLLSGEAGALVVGLVGVLIIAMTTGLVVGLGTYIQVRDNARPTYPNQGVHSSRRNGLRMGLVYGLAVGLVVGLLVGLPLMLLTGMEVGLGAGLNAGLNVGLVFGLFSGMLVGVLLGLRRYGGQTVVQHYTLRWLLARQGVLPFPFKDQALIAYLDAMADRILLRRVGGGWVFIHRTLLDYFASLHPEAAATDNNG